MTVMTKKQITIHDAIFFSFSLRAGLNEGNKKQKKRNETSMLSFFAKNSRMSPNEKFEMRPNEKKKRKKTKQK